MEIKLPSSDQISELVAKGKNSISQKGIPVTGRISSSVAANSNPVVLDIPKFSTLDKLGLLVFGDDATPEKIAISIQYYTANGTPTPMPSLSDENFLFFNLLNTDGDTFFSVLRFNTTTKRYSVEMKTDSMVFPFGFRLVVKNLSTTAALNVRTVYVYRNMEG